MTEKKHKNEWYMSFAEEWHDLVDELEDWFQSFCCCCEDNGGSKKISYCCNDGDGIHHDDREDGRCQSWTPEEEDAVNDLTMYLEMREPMLKEDCPDDLKQHLDVIVDSERMLALNLLASSCRSDHKIQAAAHLLTIARFMVVKGRIFLTF